jgi:hypothetical protein
MTARYAHLSKGHLRVGMELFDSGLAMDTIWTPTALPSSAPQKQDDGLRAAVVEELP